MTITNGAVSQFCRAMTEMEMPLDSAAEAFLKQQQRNGAGRDLGHLTGQLAEIVTCKLVEEIAKKDPAVQIYWLSERVEKEPFVYLPSQNNTPAITIKTSKGNKTISEVDLVTLIEGHPVIIETAMGRYRSMARGAGFGKYTSTCTVTRLQPENVDGKKRPIAHLFGTEKPEIIYVIPLDEAGKVNDPHSRMARYVASAGNHIVPFPLDRRTWRILAESVVFQLV